MHDSAFLHSCILHYWIRLSSHVARGGETGRELFGRLGQYFASVGQTAADAVLEELQAFELCADGR